MLFESFLFLVNNEAFSLHIFAFYIIFMNIYFLKIRKIKKLVVISSKLFKKVGRI